MTPAERADAFRGRLEGLGDGYEETGVAAWIEACAACLTRDASFASMRRAADAIRRAADAAHDLGAAELRICLVCVASEMHVEANASLVLEAP